jgi:hypothetical protein
VIEEAIGLVWNTFTIRSLILLMFVNYLLWI